MIELNIKKLTTIQAKKCLSINELAELAGLHRVAISNIIHGKRKATPKTIGMIAKGLGVEVEQLIN